MFNWEEKKSLVLYQLYWYKGVIGIVVVCFFIDFYWFIVVFIKLDDVLVGLVCLVGNINFFEVIEFCEDLLLSFGGYINVVGLLMEECNWFDFICCFE